MRAQLAIAAAACNQNATMRDDSQAPDPRHFASAICARIFQMGQFDADPANQ